MYGWGSGELWDLAEFEMAQRRQEASRYRLMRDYGCRQAGLLPSLTQAIGRGLIRVGERLQGTSLVDELAAEKNLRLDRVPAS